MSKIKAELLEATGLEQKRGETEASLISRIVDIVDDNDKFSGNDFNKLSEKTQEFCNTACTARGKNKPLPTEFPDAEKADGEKAEAKGGKKKGEKKEAVAKPKDIKKDEPKPEKPAKAAKEKPAKAEKPPKEPKAKKPAGGKSADLKKLILAKPTRTNAELMEMMEKKGHKISLSTLSTIRSGFLHSMQVIEQEGRLKDKAA